MKFTRSGPWAKSRCPCRAALTNFADPQEQGAILRNSQSQVNVGVLDGMAKYDAQSRYATDESLCETGSNSVNPNPGSMPARCPNRRTGPRSLPADRAEWDASRPSVLVCQRVMALSSPSAKHLGAEDSRGDTDTRSERRNPRHRRQAASRWRKFDPPRSMKGASSYQSNFTAVQVKPVALRVCGEYLNGPSFRAWRASSHRQQL